MPHLPNAQHTNTPKHTATNTASTSAKKRVLSGIQPTGEIHLGNYLGAEIGRAHV